jgi:hypothetical protein
MPIKKGKNIASRQAQLQRKAKQKSRHAPALSETQLHLSTAGSDTTVESPPTNEKALAAPEDEENGGVITAAAPLTPSGPARAPTLRARRQQQAMVAQAGPRVRSELLRIGIVTSIVGITLAVLKLATDLGD